jgi:phosphatidylglycerophosphate synthase
MREVWGFDSVDVKLYYSATLCLRAEDGVVDRLGKSIVGTVLAYFILQVCVFGSFAAFAVPSQPSLPRTFLFSLGPVFLTVVVAYHLLLLVTLLLFKQDFVKVPSGEKLQRVNLANAVTLFRLTSMPTVLFLVLAARDYRIRIPLLSLVVLVFATDFFDGYISRTAGEVTKVGKMMDSASDYGLLLVLTIVFYYFTLIPPWFFLLVTARLGLQVVLVFILIFINKRIEPKTTFMGKAAVASIMVLYAAEVARLIFGIGRIELVAGLEWMTAAIVLVSMVDKVVAFVRELPRTA